MKAVKIVEVDYKESVKLDWLTWGGILAIFVYLLIVIAVQASLLDDVRDQHLKAEVKSYDYKIQRDILEARLKVSEFRRELECTPPTPL